MTHNSLDRCIIQRNGKRIFKFVLNVTFESFTSPFFRREWMISITRNTPTLVVERKNSENKKKSFTYRHFCFRKCRARKNERFIRSKKRKEKSPSDLPRKERRKAGKKIGAKRTIRSSLCFQLCRLVMSTYPSNDGSLK